MSPWTSAALLLVGAIVGFVVPKLVDAPRRIGLSRRQAARAWEDFEAWVEDDLATVGDEVEAADEELIGRGVLESSLRPRARARIRDRHLRALRARWRETARAAEDFRSSLGLGAQWWLRRRTGDASTSDEDRLAEAEERVRAAAGSASG